MTIKISGNSKQSETDKLKKKIFEKIKEATFEATDIELNINFKKSMPKVSGRVFKSMRRNRTRGNFRKKSIMKIGRGMTALTLQRYFKTGDVELRKAGYPEFVTFEKEPSLKEWVEQKTDLPNDLRSKFLARGGLTVGGKNTRFGSKQNRWFDKGIILTKKRLTPRLKRAINKKLKEI